MRLFLFIWAALASETLTTVPLQTEVEINSSAFASGGPQRLADQLHGNGAKELVARGCFRAGISSSASSSSDSNVSVAVFFFVPERKNKLENKNSKN